MGKFLLKLAGLCIVCQLASGAVFGQRNMERLDRGLVAVRVSSGVFLSWRMFGTDPRDVSFNLYRDGQLVNQSPISGATNYTDTRGAASSVYTVRAISGGTEQPVGATARVWPTQVLTVNLQRPPGGTTASGAFSYSPNDISVGDVDGDGQYELILKWDPANSRDNSQSGHTGNVIIDCYKLDGTRLWRIDLGRNIRAGAHYTQVLVADYDGDGKAEVAMKTAPGTRDGSGRNIRMGPAANADHSADYRNSSGYILTGPEYLSIFNGETGAEMATVNYVPARGTVSSWGDSYGNRVDRFNATNAYLSGTNPSMVFQRGYYTRMVVAAWDWNGTNLTQRWVFDTNTRGNEAMRGQGNHNIMAADGDGDGFDEIYTGSGAINHDGRLMWTNGMGHGDANHIGDFDPSNPGLEIWQVTENRTARYDHLLIDARTGRTIWGGGGGTDNGRGMIADLDAGTRGHQAWSSAVSGTYNASGGARYSAAKPSSSNFRVYWDGDLQDELLDRNRIDKWSNGATNRLFALTGNSCNGTKATPNLSADILGDWREEVILHDGASRLYIHTTTIPTTHKLYTLMHDPVYRNAISSQQSSYNQPPHLGFNLAQNAANPPVPNIVLVGEGSAGAPDCSGIAGGSAYTDDCGKCVAGNTGIEPCLTDCAGIENGNAMIDSCGMCYGGGTGRLPCTFIVEAEAFCLAVGVAETTHAGYRGQGYLNFDNTMGSSASWKLYADTITDAELAIAFANGGNAARPMQININGTAAARFEAPATGAWTSWRTEFVNIELSAGLNTLELVSLTADGGPNVDALYFFSSNAEATSCDTKTLNLKKGWNLIGYPLPDAKPVTEALRSIQSYLVSVKDNDGFWDASQPIYLNSLNQLDWSKGYYVKVSADCQIMWQ
jgi:hypothetical protein